MKNKSLLLVPFFVTLVLHLFIVGCSPNDSDSAPLVTSTLTPLITSSPTSTKTSTKLPPTPTKTQVVQLPVEVNTPLPKYSEKITKANSEDLQIIGKLENPYYYSIVPLESKGRYVLSSYNGIDIRDLNDGSLLKNISIDEIYSLTTSEYYNREYKAKGNYSYINIVAPENGDFFILDTFPLLVFSYEGELVSKITTDLRRSFIVSPSGNYIVVHESLGVITTEVLDDGRIMETGATGYTLYDKYGTKKATRGRSFGEVIGFSKDESILVTRENYFEEIIYHFFKTENMDEIYKSQMENLNNLNTFSANILFQYFYTSQTSCGFKNIINENIFKKTDSLKLDSTGLYLSCPKGILSEDGKRLLYFSGEPITWSPPILPFLIQYEDDGYTAIGIYDLSSEDLIAEIKGIYFSLNSVITDLKTFSYLKDYPYTYSQTGKSYIYDSSPTVLNEKTLAFNSVKDMLGYWSVKSTCTLDIESFQVICKNLNDYALVQTSDEFKFVQFSFSRDDDHFKTLSFGFDNQQGIINDERIGFWQEYSIIFTPINNSILYLPISDKFIANAYFIDSLSGEEKSFVQCHEGWWGRFDIDRVKNNIATFTQSKLCFINLIRRDIVRLNFEYIIDIEFGLHPDTIFILYSSDSDSILGLYNYSDFSFISKLKVEYPKGVYPSSIAINQNESVFSVGFSDGTISFYDLENGSILGTKKISNSKIIQIKYLNYNKLIALTDQNHSTYFLAIP